MTDIELWTHIISGNKGNKAAFEELYHRYYSPLLAYGLRLQFNEESIKDCIQDLFVKIYVNRCKLPVLSHVKPYLYRSLSNALLDTVKSIRNNTVPVDELIEVSIEDEGLMLLFKNNDEDVAKATQLKTALEELSHKQRNALYFRFIQEFTWEEMSEMFNMSTHSCMNLVGRAVGKLRAILEDLSKK